jgi:nicotinamide-nucleotide amidase
MNTIAQRIVETLRTRHEDLACAESLTGGALSSEIISVPGASHVFKGSIIAYSPEIKVRELSVSQESINSHGVVSESVALEMADGVRARMGTSWAVSATGVAGPGPSHDIPAGTVWLALVGPSHRETLKLALYGDRESVRRGAVESALGLLARILGAEPTK